MHGHAVNCGNLGDDLVQRQVALDRKPVPQPVSIGRQLALCMIALSLGQEVPTLAPEDHHVVHEAWRNPKVPCGLTVPMTFLNESDHSTTQLDRMWLAHSEPPYLAALGNHKPANLGILNRKTGDLL